MFWLSLLTGLESWWRWGCRGSHVEHVVFEYVEIRVDPGSKFFELAFRDRAWSTLVLWWAWSEPGVSFLLVVPGLVAGGDGVDHVDVGVTDIGLASWLWAGTCLALGFLLLVAFLGLVVLVLEFLLEHIEPDFVVGVLGVLDVKFALEHYMLSKNLAVFVLVVVEGAHVAICVLSAGEGVNHFHPGRWDIFDVDVEEAQEFLPAEAEVVERLAAGGR